MIVIILLMEDGTTKKFGIGDNVQSLIRAIEHNDIERIVVGDVKPGVGALWEKQFVGTDVMPTKFGERK